MCLASEQVSSVATYWFSTKNTLIPIPGEDRLCIRFFPMHITKVTFLGLLKLDNTPLDNFITGRAVIRIGSKRVQLLPDKLVR